MAEAKAVIVEADDLEAAKKKVAKEIAGDCVSPDPPEGEEFEAILQEELDEYGSTWFVQELAEETL